MRVGIGLPTTFPDVSGTLMIEWALSAERQRLASLGVLDRVVHDGYEPLAALAAAAAVTSRIDLVTMIVIGPDGREYTGTEPLFRPLETLTPQTSRSTCSSAALTDAMVHSGVRVTYPGLPGTPVD